MVRTPRAVGGEELLPLLHEAARATELQLRVRGRCMEPVLCEGERFTVRHSRVIFPGDVVAFLDAHDQLTVHRALGYRPAIPHRAWTLLTQSDAAGSADAAVPLRRVLGVVVLPPGRRPTLRQRGKSLFRWTRQGLKAIARRLR